MSRKWVYLAWLLIFLGLPQTIIVNAADTSLVGWWKFDETSGNIAHDSSGYGNHGVLYGGLQLKGGGLEFDAVDDYVDCGGDESLNITREVTVMAWINLAGPAQDRKIAGNQDGITGGYKLGVYSNKVEFEIRTAGNVAVLNRSIAGGIILDQHVYHHVAGVYSSQGGYIRTYVNGDLDRELSTTAELGTSTGTFKIGREPFSNLYFWLGLMHDLRVYNRALAQDEIKAIAQGENPFASNPNPADGAMYPDTWVTLTWTPGAGAVLHDVYFGDDFADVEAGTAGTFQSRQLDAISFAGLPGFSFPDGLVPGTTYYWRIDEIGADGTVYTGNVWRFTVESFEEFPTWNMPDPAVTRLTLEPERANPGESISIRASVANVGTAAAGIAELIFLVHDVEIAREVIETLGPSEEIQIRRIWVAESPGRHPGYYATGTWTRHRV